MKKSDYTGWRDVFIFSFCQSFKQKAYWVFLLIMTIVMLCIVPVMTLFGKADNKGEAESSAVTVFTVYDETGLGIDYSKALEGTKCQNVKLVVNPEGSFEEHTSALENSEDSTELILQIAYEEAGYFNLTYVKAADADLEKEDIALVQEAFEEFFEEARIKAIDVTQEQLAFINQTVSTKVEFTAEDGELIPSQEAEGISMEEYFILLGALMIVTLIISFSGSSIATSIVTEKSTRVVEYMMINIRPMALIIGKILAALLLVMIQFGCMGLGYLASTIINGVIFGNTGVSLDGVTAVMSKLTGLNLMNVLLVIAVILLGVLFYGIIAGLAGASVSKLEEMAEGMKTYQMLLLIGAYPGIFLAIMEMTGSGNALLTNIGSIFPLTSPFVLPANLLMGKAGMGAAVAGIAVLALATVLLFSFTAKVYEAMIFYNGSVLKTKDILQIAKNRQAVQKGE